MREIKFRAWHKNNKSMCQNVTTDLLDRDYLEFMEFTGLKDENGKEIYEGDIVVYHDIPEDDYKDDCYVSGEIIFTSAKFLITGELEDDLIELHDDIKVIGNVYENKELLEFDKVNKFCRQLEVY